MQCQHFGVWPDDLLHSLPSLLNSVFENLVAIARRNPDLVSSWYDAYKDPATDLSVPSAVRADALGSHTLANICAALKYGDTVAVCGLAQGFDLPATVTPFIPCGVTLIAVDSVCRPKKDRIEAWNRLAVDFDLHHIEAMVTEYPLTDATQIAADQMQAMTNGRVFINVNALACLTKEHKMNSNPISRIPLPDITGLSGDVKGTVLAVQAKRGPIPNVFWTLAYRHDEFRAFMAYHDALMALTMRISATLQVSLHVLGFLIEWRILPRCDRMTSFLHWHVRKHSTHGGKTN